MDTNFLDVQKQQKKQHHQQRHKQFCFSFKIVLLLGPTGKKKFRTSFQISIRK